MQRNQLFMAGVCLLALSSAARGQSLLNKLESQLPKAGDASAAAAVPGTGYLGAVLDEAMNRGVRVEQVRAGTPAELGGLKAGDIISQIDSKPIAKMDDLDAVLNMAVPGQRLRMTVDRGGKQQIVNVMLGTRQAAPPSSPRLEDPSALTPVPAPTPSLTSPTEPTSPAPPTSLPPSLTPAAPSVTPGSPSTAPVSPFSADPFPAPATSTPPTTPALGTIRSRPSEPTQPSQPAFGEPALSTPTFPAAPAPTTTATGGASLGIMVDVLNDEARLAYGLSVRRGALITSVRPDSPAEQAGLPVGGAVIALDGRRIDSPDDLVASIKAARPGQEVEVTYYQGDRLNKKSIRLGAASGGGASSAAAGEAASGAKRSTAGDRPLLSRVERMIDNLPAARGNTVSSYYNPAEMAALQKSMAELTEQLRSLDERLKAIESRGSGPVPPPAAGSFPGAGNP